MSEMFLGGVELVFYKLWAQRPLDRLSGEEDPILQCDLLLIP